MSWMGTLCPVFNGVDSYQYWCECCLLVQVRKIKEELVQRYEEMQVEKTQFDALKAMVADMENELVREQLKVRALEGA